MHATPTVSELKTARDITAVERVSVRPARVVVFRASGASTRPNGQT